MRFGEMGKITGTQKKIIIVSAVVLVAFLFTWLFVYQPARNKVARIKTELENVNSQIERIEGLVEEGKPIGEEIDKLQKEFDALSAKFPRKEEEALRLVSGFARKLGIEVVSIKPQPKRLFAGKEEHAIEFEGKKCQRVFVFVKMKCNYKQLVEYIDMLKGSLPAFVCVESINASKEKIEGAKTPRLKTELGLSLYLLS